MDDLLNTDPAPIAEDAPKRRGRPPKTEAETSLTQAPATSEPPRMMTFAEVMAWNRANADKLPPAPKLPPKKRPKTKRF